MNRLLLALPPLLAALALSGSGVASAATQPVGVEACRSCHSAAVAAWKEDPHAKTEEKLDARRQERACLACHGPLRESMQVGVTCEVCHGAGQHYAKGYVMRDRELARAVGLVIPGEKECSACHTANSPSLVPFDFAARMKAVEAHARADRESRRAPRPPAAGHAPPAKAAPQRPSAKDGAR